MHIAMSLIFIHFIKYAVMEAYRPTIFLFQMFAYQAASIKVHP